jgi:phosphoribosylamine--glycine ligase
MLRLKDDLLTILNAAVDGVLDQISVRWRDEAALCVVLASDGYPGPFERGTEIWGVDEAASWKTSKFFTPAHAEATGACSRKGVGSSVSPLSDGRFPKPSPGAYQAVDRIDWPHGFCRRDIGWRAVGRRTGEARD